MNEQEICRYEMMRRVCIFCVMRKADFPKTSLAVEVFAVIKEVVANLKKSSTAQISSRGSSRAGTSNRAAARIALREDMVAVSRTAKALTHRIEDLEDKFLMPRNCGDQKLLIAARKFIIDATPLKDQFIRYELPTTFLEDLQGYITALEQAIAEQNAATTLKITATPTVDDTIYRGVSAVEQLDAIVKNKYRDDAETLAAWLVASHTERVSQVAKLKPPVKPAK